MTDETTGTVPPEAAPEAEKATEEQPSQPSSTETEPVEPNNTSESGFTDDPSSASVPEEAEVEDGDEVVDSEDSSKSAVPQEEDVEVIEPSTKPVAKEIKRPGMAKGVLEYDLADMYPEVSVLVGKPRREWNFHDPEIIRAMWLDSKTHAITDWKIRYANLRKARQAQVEIPLNHTAQLRLEFQKQKEEQKKEEFRRQEVMLANSKITPEFNTVQMATTTTVEMRYKFTRNNPPVPSYYINHYDKYKKPPFKTKVGRPCKPDQP